MIGKTVGYYLSKYIITIILPQTSGTISKMQALVSSDGRHRNLQDALHRYVQPIQPNLISKMVMYLGVTRPVSHTLAYTSQT